MAIATLMAALASTATAYEYNTTSGTSTTVTMPSGTTATFGATGQTTMSAAAAHSVSNATTTMFAPNIAVGTTVSELTTDISGCPSIANSTATCSRGTFTINFSRPVTNPLIHFSGFGGAGTVDYTYSCGIIFTCNGTTTGLHHVSGSLTASSPAGATLGAVPAGSVNFQTVGNAFRAVNDRLNNTCDVVGASPRQAAGGCGTVPVNGTVTSLTFAMTGRVWADETGTVASGAADAVRVSVSTRQDFSDAPTSYNSTQAPAHLMTDLKLGSTVDEENSTVANSTTSPVSVAADADANGTNGDGADEDAITSWPSLTTANVGSNYSVTVPISGATASGRVCGWIDFNRSGAFDNTNERACADFISGATSVSLTWAVPASATTAGTTYARLRASYNTTQAQSPTGVADSGEVEDYTVAILPVVRVNKVLTSVYSDTFDLRLNSTNFATGIGNGGTTGNRTAFHTSSYGTPNIVVGQNIANAPVPVTFSEVASGGNLASYGTSHSCLDATGATVASGGGTSKVVNVPQSTGTNAQAQNITCTFTNIITVTDPVITAPTDGTLTNDNTPTISGTSQPNVTVNVYEGFTLLCTATANGAGAWSCTAGSAQSDGDHDYRALANYSGSYSDFSAEVALTIDTTAPSAPTISVPANNAVTGDTTPTVSGTAEAGSTVTIYVDSNPVGSTTADGSGNWTFVIPSAQSQGAHTINAIATDAASNTGVASADTNVVIDTTAPVVSISAPANGSLTGDTTPTLNFSVTETHPGTSECRVDGGSWTTCTSGGSLAALLDGPHTVDVRHTDVAGNVGSTSSTFTVDATAPAAPVMTLPVDGTVTDDSTPTFSGTAEANSTVTVYASGSPIGTTTADGSGNWSLTPGSPLTDGDYEFSATATDAVNNTGLESAPVNVTVDTTAPAAPSITAPTSGSSTNDSTPTISGTAEPNSTVIVYADDVEIGTTTADGSGNWSLVPVTPLSVGANVLTATSTDAADNVSVESAPVTVTLDQTNPAVVITSPGLVVGDSTPTVTFSATDDGALTIECSVDGGAFVACGPTDYTTGALLDGPHYVTVRATDAGGNVGQAVRYFTVDTAAQTAPAITTPTDGTTTNDTTPTVSGASEADSTVRVYAGVVLVGTTTADGSGNWTLDSSALVEGDYELTATAEDDAGNVSAASSIVNITIDVTAPSAPVISSPSDGLETTDSTPTVSGTAEVGSTVRVYAGAVLVGTTTADGSGNWTLDTSALAEGDHVLTATAEDEAGNVGAASSAVDITIDLTAPIAPAITTPTDGAITNDTTPAVSGTAEAGSTVRVYAGVALVGTTTANGSGNWTLSTSALSNGIYELTATAEDEAGNIGPASSVVEITVDTTAATAPTIASPADGTFTNDTTPTVSGTADPSDTVRVYADGVLVGTTTADGSGNWTLDTSALTPDAYVLTAVAQNGIGNLSSVSNAIDITIDTTAPAAPSVTTPTDGSSTNDTTPTISGTAEPNSIVEVFVDTISIGSVAADGSGNWTITPGTPLAEGDRDITAVATDAANNSGVPSTTTTVTIDTTDPSLTIDAPGMGEAINDNTLDVEFTATDNGSITATCSIDGSAFAPCSSPLSIGPLSEGDHTVVINVEDEAGNDTQESVTFTIDTLAPDTFFSSIPPVVTSSTTASFEFLSNEEDTTFECSLDGGAYVSCSSPNMLSDLDAGAHTFEVRAVDTAGNFDSTPASYAWLIDTTTPSAPTIATPADGTLTNDSTPDLTGSAEPNATVTIFDDGSPIGTTTADGSGNWTFTPPTALDDGDHELTATAEDAAGNESSPSPVTDLAIDTDPPSTSFVATPSTPTNNDSPSFTVAGDEPVTAFECSLDDGDFATCSEEPAFFALSDGWHTLRVRSIDMAGNVDPSPTSLTWEQDTLDPDAPVVTGPSSGQITGDNTPPLSGTAEPNSVVTIYVDDQAIGTVTTDDSGTWSLNSTTLTDGSHAVTARSEDPAGNSSGDAVVVNFTVDTTAPSGNVIVQSGTGGPGVAPTFDIGSDDPDAETTCSINGGPATTCSTPYTPIGLAPGDYTLLVTYTDGAGNTSTSTTNFTVIGVASGPSPSAPDADPLPSACFPKGITIYELKVAGSKLQIRGFARSQYIGQEVTLNFQPTKTKVIGKTKVNSDGSFFATVKAPKKSLRKKGTTRYRANVGGESSFWFKLDRRMGSNLATYSGGKLNVAGFLTKPLDPKSKLTVTVRSGCNDPWTKIGDFKVNRSGAFKGSIAYPTDSRILFVRMYAKVRKTAKSKKTLTTYSFVVPVVTGR